MYLYHDYFLVVFVYYSQVRIQSILFCNLRLCTYLQYNIETILLYNITCDLKTESFEPFESFTTVVWPEHFEIVNNADNDFGRFA